MGPRAYAQKVSYALSKAPTYEEYRGEVECSKELPEMLAPFPGSIGYPEHKYHWQYG